MCVCLVPRLFALFALRVTPQRPHLAVIHTALVLQQALAAALPVPTPCLRTGHDEAWPRSRFPDWLNAPHPIPSLTGSISADQLYRHSHTQREEWQNYQKYQQWRDYLHLHRSRRAAAASCIG